LYKLLLTNPMIYFFNILLFFLINSNKIYILSIILEKKQTFFEWNFFDINHVFKLKGKVIYLNDIFSCCFAKQLLLLWRNCDIFDHFFDIQNWLIISGNNKNSQNILNQHWILVTSISNLKRSFNYQNSEYKFSN